MSLSAAIAEEVTMQILRLVLGFGGIFFLVGLGVGYCIWA